MKRLLVLPILIAALAVASFATVSFSPSSLSFGSQAVRTTSAVKFVTFSNSGSTRLSFGTETIAGDYTWGGVGTCGPTLAANSSCTMSLIFKPTASGTRTGSLTVGSMVVSLTGTGGSTTTPPVTVQALKPTTTSLTSGTMGKAYSAALTATGGTSPYKWSVASGTLPAGLTLSTTGTISGTPKASGTSSFSVAVKDSETTPQNATATLKLTISATAPVPAALKLTTATLANGTVGSSYSATLQASGGTSPYKWSVASGSLPAGLTLSTTGTISGTPTIAEASSFSVTAKDSESSPQAATSTLALTVIKGTTSVTPPPSTGSSTLATAYTAYVAANYGSAKGYTSANTYYVSSTGSDNNSGTAASPWATLEHADNATPACALILFNSGTYSNGAINSSSSGSSSCHKAFASQSYLGAILSDSSTGSDGSATLYASGEYVDIVGFTITGPACIGIQPAGSNEKVLYNYVYNVAQGSGQCGNGVGGGGIAPGEGGGQNVTINYNVLYNVGSTANSNSGQNVHGIYVTSSGFTIEDNVVYVSTGGCIQAYHSPSNGIISNNTLVGCKWGYIWGNDNSGAASNIAFNNNTMSGMSGYDIFTCGASNCGAAVGSGNTFSNNDTPDANNISDGGTLVNNITSAPNLVKVAVPPSGNFAPNSGSPLIGTDTTTDAAPTNILGVSTRNIGAY